MKSLYTNLSSMSLLILITISNSINAQFLFQQNLLKFGLGNGRVNAVEDYNGDYYIVDGSLDPSYPNNYNGLLRIKKDKSVKPYNQQNGNLPTNYVYSVLKFNDTLLIAADKGIYFLEGDSFLLWNNFIDPVYRLTYFRNNLLLATPKGPVLYKNGRFQNLNSLFKCPENSVFHADMNDKIMVVCYKDSIKKLNLSTFQINEYKVSDRSAMLVKWNAYAIDDYVMVVAFRRIKPTGQSVYIITNDSIKYIADIQKSEFCSPELRLSRTDYLDYTFFTKHNKGFYLFSNWGLNGSNYGSAFLDWSTNIQQTKFDIYKRYYQMLHINESQVMLKYLDTIWVESRQRFDSSMNFYGGLVAKLNRNQVQAGVGCLNFNSYVDMCTFKVKSENCNCMSLGRALWMGGKTETGDLKLAATLYLQRGNDFFPGPLRKTGETNEWLMKKYSRVWTMSKELIEDHIAAVNKLGKNQNVANEIKNWPVYEIDNNDTIKMAPFEDVNSNGYYDPEYGDYPKIKGHEAIFWVMNDNGGIHSQSMGKPLKIQVNGLAYSYDCKAKMPDSLDYFLQHATFVEYQIIYKGSEKLKDVFVGQWFDVDLGNYKDDALGSAPIHQTGFIMNADANDEGESGTGINPGAAAVTILKGPIAQNNDGIDNDNDGVKDELNEDCKMSGITTYNNDNNGIKGNPERDFEYYNLLKSLYLNGDSIYKNAPTGQKRVRHLYSHGLDPDYPNMYWTKNSSDSLFARGDQRMLLSSGAFELIPGQEVPFHTVFYYVRNSKDSNQLPGIINGSKKLSAVYNGEFIPDCWMLKTTKTNKNHIPELKLIPNPTYGEVRIFSNVNGSDLSIKDAQGRIVLRKQNPLNQCTVNTAHWQPGLYYVEWHTNGGVKTAKLLVR